LREGTARGGQTGFTALGFVTFTGTRFAVETFGAGAASAVVTPKVKKDAATAAHANFNIVDSRQFNYRTIRTRKPDCG
jgi:hypothetical protein